MDEGRSPLDDVEEGLVDRIGFRVELGHVRKLEAHRPDRSGEVGEGTRSSVHLKDRPQNNSHSQEFGYIEPPHQIERTPFVFLSPSQLSPSSRCLLRACFDAALASTSEGRNAPGEASTGAPADADCERPACSASWTCRHPRDQPRSYSFQPASRLLQGVSSYLLSREPYLVNGCQQEDKNAHGEQPAEDNIPSAVTWGEIGRSREWIETELTR